MKNFKIEKNTVNLKSKFKKDGIVVIRNFLTNEGLFLLDKITKDLSYIRKNITIEKTPRIMSVCGGKSILDNENVSRHIKNLYLDKTLLSFLSDISGDKVTKCRDKTEWVISTSLHTKGDTHGWHKDDYPYALILVVEAPKNKSYGGTLSIMDTVNHEKDIFLNRGDAYFFKSDKLQHCVKPLLKNSKRTIFNFTYSSNGNHDVNISNTARELCE